MAAPSPDLVFSQTPNTSQQTALVFGDDGLGVIAPVVVNVAAVLSGIVVAAFLATPVKVNAAATLGGVTASGQVFYDRRVTNYLDVRAATGHQVAQPRQLPSGLPWGLSQEMRGSTPAGWTLPLPIEALVRAVHTPANAVRKEPRTPWQLAQQLRTSARNLHQVADPRAARAEVLWQVADRKSVSSVSGMQTGIPRAIALAAWWQVGQARQRETGGGVGASLHRIGAQWVTMPWGTGTTARPGRSPRPPVVMPPAGGVWSADLVFQCPPLSARSPALVFDVNPCFVYTPGVPAAVVVPIRKVYVVLNSASLRRVNGNIPIHTFGMSLSIDWQSWTWAFSTTLPGSELDKVLPGANGDPVEVEAMINGVAYRALVESVSRSRTFGAVSLRVSGRGVNAELDAPYAPVLNFGNATARTAQQLMGDVLSINNVPLPDWTVDWALDDWLVPGGIWTHQGSYISALNNIVGAAGGYLQPNPSDKTLRALHKYPVAPWDWGSVTPDYELPSAITTVEGIEWADKPLYNRVFVSGVNAGVLGQYTRSGTDGGLVAEMVTDSLITAAAAARQRGRAIIGDTGRQANVSLRLPVLPATGLILPGKFVKYTDEGTDRVGIVRSMNVEVGMPEIMQNITLETHL